jgi:hypothetical protein
MLAPEMRPGRAWLLLLAAVALLRPISSFAGNLSFSGSLVRVGRESISIKLADRRVIDARLPNAPALAAGKIAAQYVMGDQVQVTCKSIRPVWEESTSRYQYLEVTALRLVRRLPPAELAQMLAFPPFREGENLLSHSNGAEAAPGLSARRAVVAGGLDAAVERKLEHMRDVNLGYASNMPNFVADETAKRYTSDDKSPEWRYLDTIETEIAFVGNRAVRQQIRRNGKPWDRPFETLPGFKWYGGFGTEIRPVFDPQCPTTLAYEGSSEVRGRQVLEYRFSSQADGCFAPFYFEYQRYNPERTGHAFVEDLGGNVIRLDETATGFPPDFEFARREEQVSWDYVRIGNASHLLPVGANFLVVYSSGARSRVEVEYRNHRHFEAATNLTFH